MGQSTLTAFLAVALPLAATICIESGVAALLGFRRRQLGVVVWVNFITNPPLNLVWMSLFWLGLGKTIESAAGRPARVVPATWMWLLLAGLEVLVIVAEWRLLLMALGRRPLSSRRLLAISVAMNAVSATLGTFLLGRLI